MSEANGLVTAVNESCNAAEALPAVEAPASQEDRRHNGDLAMHSVWLAVCASVLLLAFVLKVRAGTEVLLPFFDKPLPEMCQMRRAFGISCPGCGLTRCFISLAHLQVADAWKYNPAGLLLFGIVLLQLPYRLIQIVRNLRGNSPWTPHRAWLMLLPALFVLLVIQWIIRELPSLL